MNKWFSFLTLINQLNYYLKMNFHLPCLQSLQFWYLPSIFPHDECWEHIFRPDLIYQLKCIPTQPPEIAKPYYLIYIVVLPGNVNKKNDSEMCVIVIYWNESNNWSKIPFAVGFGFDWAAILIFSFSPYQ